MKKIIYLHIFLFTILLSSTNVYGKRIPNLVGKWEGVNIKSTLKNGFVKGKNIIEITDQKDRVFKGHVIHKGGTEEFVGVFKSDYKNFYWADSSNDDGKVIGTIIKKNKIETCYLDSGRDAIAGCSILERIK